MDGDFRTHFVREPSALKQFPALVLNADYRPLSYYPLSLWPWQEAGFTVYGHVMEGTGHGIAPDGLSVALSFIRERLGV